MKKIVILSLLLAACAGATDAGSGLVRLNSEPTNCEHLYTIDSTATTYSLADAYGYVEKSILEKSGDSYFVVNETVTENKDAVFGPRNTYKFKIKVYNCKK